MVQANMQTTASEDIPATLSAKILRGGSELSNAAVFVLAFTLMASQCPVLGASG
jgi:hypothetical protein